MNINNKLAKLCQRQQKLTAALRETAAEADNRQRKALHRSKILLGEVVLAMPNANRQALLLMLLERMSERNREFVTTALAQTDDPKFSATV